MTTKAMTVRLPADLAGELEAVAAIDGKPVSEVVRAAIAAFIRKRIADPEFQFALAAWLAHLQRLADHTTDTPDDQPTCTSDRLTGRLDTSTRHLTPIPNRSEGTR